MKIGEKDKKNAKFRRIFPHGPGHPHLTADHDPAPGADHGVDDIRGGPGVGEDVTQRGVPQREPPVLNTGAGKIIRGQVNQA